MATKQADRSRAALIAVLALAAAALVSPGRAQQRPANGNPPFVEPTALHSVGGLLDATLILKQERTPLAGKDVDRVWTFHEGELGGPNYPGPTLYVNPGDTIRLRYVNQLPLPNGDFTNLHTHGLHVSPLGNSDNVLLAIPTGAENQYEIQIPASHPFGLYWYHPHHHGQVNPQIYNGLAGLIVIGRPDSGASQLAGLAQRLLALQYSYIDEFGPGNHLLVPNGEIPFTVNNQGQAFFEDVPEKMFFTVNGLLNPLIDMQQGATEVWNFANISDNGYFKIRLRGTGGAPDPPLPIVAQDGNPYTTPIIVPPGETLLIPPAARYSIMVSGPIAGGLELLMEYHSDGFFQWPPSFAPMGVPYQQGRALATIVTHGPLGEQTLVPPVLTPPANYFTPLQNLPVDKERAAVFTIDPPAFLINGQQFPNNPVFQPRLNRVEEWDLVDASPVQHPFHIHVNDFQIQSISAPNDPGHDTNTPAAFFQDIINLPEAANNMSGLPPGQVRIRMLPLDFLGTYVYHCHRVDHEDAGMMALVTIIPETPVYAAGNGRGTPPKLRAYSGITNDLLAEVFPFPQSWRGGVRVAVGDINRDGIDDVLAVPGPGDRAEVLALDGATNFQTELYRFRVFEQTFRGGLNVAAGDMNSDGYDDIIVAPASGRPPDVEVYSGKDGSLLGGFQAYEAAFRGGVTLASQIVQDGGRYSIITGTGPGGASKPLVKVWDVDWYGTHGTASCRCGAGCHCSPCRCAARASGCGCGQACSCGSCRCGVRPQGFMGALPFVETASVMAYLEQYGGGVNVGAGPIDAQNGGFSAILTVPNQSATAEVKSFVLVKGSHGAHAAGGPGAFLQLMASFLAFSPVQRSGASVSAVSTLTGADVVLTPATSGPGQARRFRFDALTQQFVLVDDFPVFPRGRMGANIGGK